MFKYINNELVLEQGEKQTSIASLAKQEKTAFYLYDINGIKDWYQFFIQKTQNKIKVFFSVKCNNNLHVLKAFKDMGSGVDVVSGGEAKLAQKIGFTSQQIVFSGVGKNLEELEMAISQNFFQINVESFEELQVIVAVAKRLNKTATIGLRLNPNVDVDTHPHIRTGLREHKFGIDISDLNPVLDIIKKSPTHLTLQGLSMHIGSQIFDLKPMYQAIKNIKNIYQGLKKEHPSLKTLDIGGGLGFDYSQENLEMEKQMLTEFGESTQNIFKDFSGSVLAEPGRFLVAPFGILCAKIEYVKQTSHKQFVILNSGMNHFLRPALYSAKHRLLPLTVYKDKKNKTYDVVGPICETGDSLAKDCSLPAGLKRGDFLAIADVGAYGHVMSNSYNLQASAPEISLLNGNRL